MTGGVIAGAILRHARLSAGLTQEDMAEAVGADPGTVKGWETGRRPLSAVKAGRLAGVRRALARAGASRPALGLLGAAVDADAFTSSVIAGDASDLAAEVITRPWTRLVAWAVAGAAPGGATVAPLLCPADRAAFFASIREAADRAPDSPGGMLLRRQAYYLTGWDDTQDGQAWLAACARAEQARMRLGGRWQPGWAVARSLAVAQSARGDTGPLGWFIDRGLSHPATEDANLAYWAYWIGADPEPAGSDDFMAERPTGPASGAALLRHLAAGLAAVPYADLSAAAIDTITTRWPYLLAADPGTAALLRDAAGQLLDSGAPPGPDRRRLSDIHAAAAAGLRDATPEERR